VTSPVIAMIGTGNMGTSLIGGLIKNGHPSDKIVAFDHDQKNLNHAKQSFAIQAAANNVAAISAADVVVLAVKPNAFSTVAKELKATVSSRKPLIISIAAGVREASIQELLGGGVAIVRTMPNTPALIGCGATALYANSFVSREQRVLAESIMGAVGVAVWLADESLMDVVTALSGSGPAYFFLVMEALQNAAEQMGLPAETARLLTLQTALGATRMAIESGKSLVELRRLVTSPGGTTEKAISVLEEHNIHEIFRKALQSAKLQSEELAKMIHK